MATYVLKQPVLKAVQFDGENQEEVAEVVMGEVDGKKVMAPTGKLTRKGEPELEELKIVKGDWVTRDLGTGEVVINPKGFPDAYNYIP